MSRPVTQSPRAKARGRLCHGLFLVPDPAGGGLQRHRGYLRDEESTGAPPVSR
ncbi:hypothetical protein [Nioella halotolerans]|uniref:hypothetical protein n=1 Tax=Nioella halotolerans TaxID=2303578 RepID=UPI003F654EB2